MRIEQHDRSSQGMGGTVRCEHIGQVALDLAAGGALVPIAELDADADYPVPLRARGGQPDDLADDSDSSINRNNRGSA